MNNQALRETVQLLPENSVAYRSLATTLSEGPITPHARWGEAMSEPQWGWRVAFSHHHAKAPLPASLQDPNIRRAYHFLQGNRDDQMAQALALRNTQNLATLRFILQGLLCAKDISLESIATHLELPVDVVRLYEALFFSVRSRGGAYGVTRAFPHSRLGVVTEAEKGCDEVEQTLMRLGRDYGWREVARFAGLISIEEADESPDTMLADVERTIAANTRMLARAGHLNRPNSAGIRHGKSLMMRAKNESEMNLNEDADSRVGLGSFGMKAAVMDHFRRMSQPDVEYRLALQRQQAMRESEAALKKE